MKEVEDQAEAWWLNHREEVFSLQDAFTAGAEWMNEQCAEIARLQYELAITKRGEWNEDHLVGQTNASYSIRNKILTLTAKPRKPRGYPSLKPRPNHSRNRP